MSDIGKENKEENANEAQEQEDRYLLDFTTSSAISRVSVKFLVIYLPILWLSGFIVGVIFYQYIWFALYDNPLWWILQVIVFPLMLIGLYYLFILSCIFFSKLFLILINLVHKPKEGIFLAEKGNSDFEFWCLRTEIKKLVIWFMNNCPTPLIDILGFRWFGLKLDFSSHLHDAWCDLEFVKMGRNVLVGQGVTLMGSMIVGKYLIIKEIILDDYVVLGGMCTIAPGSIVGKDTVIAALSVTNYDQVFEEGWIYLGVPPIKIKENKYAESRRDVIKMRDVDNESYYEVEHEVNIDEDKKDLLVN
ncbi:MAG: acyltransferase [Promethearchaeota archaeon]